MKHIAKKKNAHSINIPFLQYLYQDVATKVAPLLHIHSAIKWSQVHIHMIVSYWLAYIVFARCWPVSATYLFLDGPAGKLRNKLYVETRFRTVLPSRNKAHLMGLSLSILGILNRL